MIYPNSKWFLPIYDNSGPQPGPDYSNPLTFKSTGNTTVAINKENLSYKKNTGEWTPYTANDEIVLNNNDVVSFSGTNTVVSTNFSTSGNGTLEVYGNPHSLINYSDLTTKAFYGMFSGCTNIVDASNVILSATTLAEYCYAYMFAGCTSLTAAPQLPATGLAYSCYYYMFSNCSSLISAPSCLPATTLYASCYFAMYYNCTSLTNAPIISATTTPAMCYHLMFYGCSNLSSINVNFTEWDNSSLNWVFGVASNGTFTCPTALGTNSTITRGKDNCPTKWTVINK